MRSPCTRVTPPVSDGTALTTTNLLDATVYDTDDADDAGLLALLLPGQPQISENGGFAKDVESNQRCPNGGGGPCCDIDLAPGRRRLPAPPRTVWWQTLPSPRPMA
ncbi:MAG: hypothetical protein R3F04_13205 [Lysobacteraceae bacterium]